MSRIRRQGHNSVIPTSYCWIRHGRKPATSRWQKASGYNLRALVEADISRWKRVIGGALHSQTDGRQATEVAIAVNVLNRMLELGRPNYVRII